MRKTNALLCAAALAAFAVPMARPAFGGIAVIDQSRAIHISGQAADLLLGTGPGFDETLTAGTFAPFDQSLSNTSELGGAVRAEATAQQTSTLTVTGAELHLSASGSTSYGAGGLHDRSDGLSSVYLVFTLTAADSGSGGGTVPAVALPPAAWMGLGTMGLLSGFVLCRQRRFRRE